MSHVVLFHHSLGLTPGVLDLAARIRSVGHAVTTPDLYDGATFETIEAGVAHAESIGMLAIAERGSALVAGIELSPADGPLVVIGISLGVLPAQLTAQTDARVRAAVLLCACVEPSQLGHPWSEGVPVQFHAQRDDPIVVDDGDLDAAVALTEAAGGASAVFLYDGADHLFVDSGHADFDAAATDVVLERTRALLDAVAQEHSPLG